MSYFSTAKVFNIVLLYQRSDLLSRAMATCSHLRREIENEFESDLRVWRIDIATTDEFAAEAERDLAAADVIILGVCGNEPCPAALRNWKERVVSGHGGAPRAIIALVESADDTGLDGESWSSVLRGGATQIHPEIFVWEPPEEFGEAVFQAESEVLVAVGAGVAAGD